MIKHFAALGLTTFIRLLTGFVLFVLIAREWGATAFGEFMYFFSIAALFVQVCEYGFSQQILRDIGREPTSASKRMGEFFAAKIWLTGLTLVCTSVYVALAGLSMQQMLMLLLLLIAAALMSYSDFMMACFRATGRYGRETVVTGFGNTVYFVFALAALYSDGGAIWVAAAFALGRLLHLLFTLFEYNKSMSRWQQPDFHFPAVLLTIKSGAVYGLNIAVGMLFINLDTIFISHTLGFGATGTYQAAARFYQGAAMLPPIFAGVFLPKIAAAIGDNTKLNQLVAKLNWSMLAVAILVSTFFLSGPYFYGWIYPDPSLAAVGHLLPWFRRTDHCQLLCLRAGNHRNCIRRAFIACLDVDCSGSLALCHCLPSVKCVRRKGNDSLFGAGISPDINFIWILAPTARCCSQTQRARRINCGNPIISISHCIFILSLYEFGSSSL